MTKYLNKQQKARLQKKEALKSKFEKEVAGAWPKEPEKSVSVDEIEEEINKILLQK